MLLNQFLCDIDNIAFEHGLSDGVRVRVETEGRVEFDSDEKKLLVLMRTVHAALIVLIVPWGVWSGEKDIAVGLSFAAFWGGSVVEAISSGGGIAAVGKRIAIVSGEVLLGLFAMAALVAGAGALSD